MTTTMTQLLRAATEGGYAVGAFTFWNLESLHAIVETAERLRSPVILQAGGIELDFTGRALLTRLGLEAIEAASVPAVLNLDHGGSHELCVAAVDLGFHSVMLDVSELPFDENIAATRRVVDYAHERGVQVEGELGRIGGAEAGTSVEEAEAFQTDPDEAVEFVERTGVDSLAVAIGNAHGFYKGRPKVNLDRLEQIREKVSVPLVLHGGSGIPEDLLHGAIDRGISKINIYTELCTAFLEGFKAFVHTPPQSGYIPDIFGPPRDRAMALIETKMRLFGATGNADVR